MKNPKNRPTPLKPLAIPAAVCAGLLCSVALSRAASDTWTGSTDGTWATAGNWLGNNVPGTGDTATFSGVSANTTINLGTGVTLNNILFDSWDTVAYTIGSGAVGSQTLTLGTAGGGITVNSIVPNSQLFNANLALATTGTYTFFNDSTSSTLTLAGTNTTTTTGIKVFKVDGAGNTTVSGPMVPGTGTLNLEKTGAGTLTLSGGATWSGGGVNEYLPGSTLVPAVLRQGTTLITSGFYTNNGEFTIGGVITDGGAGNDARLTMNGGLLVITGSGTGGNWFSLGRGNGTGGVSADVVLNNNAGILTANSSFGYNANNGANLPKGSLTLNNNSFYSGNGNFYIGESAGSDMTVTVNGSAGVTNSNGAGVRIGSSGKGSLFLNGGAFYTEGDLVLSYNSAAPNNGLAVVNGGTLKVATTTKRWLQVGRQGSAGNQLVVNGGVVQLDQNTDIRMCSNGSTGTNDITLKAGSILFYSDNATTLGGSGTLDLQYFSSSAVVDSFNLDGGTLTVPTITSTVANGTRVFNFNGGTLKAAVDAVTLMNLGTGNAAANVRNGGAVIDSNGKNVTVIQPLLHSAIAGDAATDGGLTKNGTGTLTLTGNNTYTGPTTVNAGALVLSGSSLNSQSISVSDAATLTLSALPLASWAPASMTVGSVSGGAVLNVTAGTTTLAPLTPGTLTFNGTANTINVVGGNFVAGNTYPLIVSATGITGTYTAGTLPAGVTGTISTVGNSIVLNVTAVNIANDIWTGVVNGTWDTTTANWTNAAAGNTYANGSTVQFDDTGLNTTTISNAAATTLTPAGVLVTNNAKNYAFKANTIIAGTAGLTKAGTGFLTNSTPNTYTGPTVINQGNVVVGIASVANVSGALGVNSAVTLANDATAALNLNGFATQVGSLAGGGPNAGNVILGAGTLTAGLNNSSTAYGGNISGTGGLTKLGAGTMTLTGTNAYTGATTVSQGAVTYASGAVQNAAGTFTIGTAAGLGTATMNVKSGSTVVFNASACNVGYLTGVGVLNLNGGDFTMGGGADLRVGSSDQAGNGPNGYGEVNMTGGTANLAALTIGRGNASNSLNSVSGSVTVSGGTMRVTNDVIVGWAGSGSAKLAITGAGTFNVAAGTATKWLRIGDYDRVRGEVDITNGNLNLFNNSSIKFSAGGPTIYSTNVFNQEGGNVTFYSDAGTNAGGSGNLDLAYSGSAAVNNTYNLNGGTLTVPAIVSTASAATRTFNFNGGTLKAAATNATFINLGSGNVALNVRNRGAIIDSNGKNIGIATTLAHSAISGDAATDGGLTKLGNGTLTLNGGYTYTGPTVVMGGALSLNGVSTTPTSVGNPVGDLTVSNAALNVTVSGGYYSIPAANVRLAGSNTISIDFGTLANNPGAAPISASGALIASGTTVLNISGFGLAVGRFPLLSTAGAVSASAFRLGTLPPGIVASLATSANSLDLVITAAGQLLSWHGADANNNLLTTWDINVSANWYDLSYNLVKYAQYSGNAYGDNVTFGDGAYNVDGTNYVNVTTRVVPATVTFSPSGAYRLGGTGGISGSTALVLTNMSGSVFLGTSNSYTGGTIVQSGTLAIASDNALGAPTGELTLSGGTLQANGSLTSARSVNLTADSNIGVVTNANARFSGVISGTGSLNKNDDGILTLSGTNTFTGHFYVHAGTVVMDAGSISNSTWNSIGSVNSDVGTLTLKGTAVFATTMDFNVGDVHSASGVLNVQDNATLTANNLFIASANTTGSTAVGTVNQTGGTVNQLSTTLGMFTIGGRNSGSSAGVGTYNLSGGTVVSSCGVRLGSYGTGTVNQFGGLFRIPTVGINLGRYAGASGTYNLNGGTLETYNVTSSTSSNAVFNFNGGTLLAAANPGNPFMSALSQANVLAGGAIIDSASNNITITQPLLNGGTGGGLTKRGAGTLTLAGANTYTGTTVVANGELLLTPAYQAGGTVTVADGAAFGVAADSMGTSATIGALTMGTSGASTLDFSYSFAGNPTNAALVAGPVTLQGTCTIHIGGNFSLGSFPVLKYSSLSGAFNSTVSASRGMAASVSNDVAHSTIYVVVSALSSPIVWTGTNPEPALTNLWALNTVTNWLFGAAPTTYQEILPPGDSVVFNDSGSGLVLLSNTVSPAQLSISNSSVAYIFQGSGHLSGVMGLTKLGAGTATMNLAGNDYSGNTVISNGTLRLGAANLIPDGAGKGEVVLAGTLDLSTFSETINGLSGSGTVDTVAGGTPLLTISNSLNDIFSGTLTNSAGTLALTKLGNGVLTLSGPSGYNGGTRANGGTLVLAGTLPHLAGSTTDFLSVNNVGATNAVLKILPGADISRYDMPIAEATSSRAAVYQSGGSLTLNRGSSIDDFKVGSGTGSYGYYRLSGGSLSGLNEIGLGGGSTGNGISNNIGVMDITGGTMTGPGWLCMGRGVGTSSGILNVSGTGVVNLTGLLDNTRRFRLNWANAAGAQSIVTVRDGGQILGPTNGVSLTTFTLDLSGANTADTLGAVNLLNGGLIQIFGVTSGNANPTTLLNFNGGTLKATATNANFLTDANLDGVYVYGNGATIDDNGVAVTVSRPLLAPTDNGVASIAVADGGSGYIGAPMVIISGGTGAGGTAVANMVDDGTGKGTYKVGSITITCPGVYTADPTASLSGGGAVTAATLGALTMAPNTSGGFIKTGPGNLVLSGANTYAGATIVSNGTLQVDGTIPGAVTVKLGATLAGTGSIGGAVTVNSGASLAPGAGIGTLTINGNLTLSAGTTNTFEVNGTTPANDVVALGAAVTYGGVLKIVPTGTFTLGQQFTLFSGAGAVNAGNFAAIEGTPGSGLAFAFTNGVLSVVAGSQAPMITGITPNVGRTNGGTVVTITGSGFVNGLTVQFGATPAALVTYTDSTLITAVTPAAAPGPVTVTVQNPDSQVATTSYTYVLPPPPATLASAVKSGNNLVLTWIGGTNENCVLFSATNVTQPRVTWTPVTTNAVLSDGRSTNTIPVNAAEPKRFYLLSVPYN